MPVFVLLSRVTSEGRKTIKENPGRISEVNREVEAFGARVLAQYAVLGPYDFCTILDAPDAETVARVSVELSSRGTVEITSRPAIEVERFTASFKKKGKK
jgi:uncharacterized protein with GYD domain